MNPRVKKLWVDALRSGKYKQGDTRALVDGHDRWNPFGVLIDVGFETTWTFDEIHDCWVCDDAMALMPMWYAREAGLNWNDESIIGAMHMHKTSFKEIAEWIDKNL